MPRAFRSRGIEIAGAVLGLAGAAALHFATWRSLPDFVRRTDDYRLIFADFVLQYRPAAEEILRSASPYPGYYYSAFFALCLTPFAAPSEADALRVWGALQLLSIAAVAWLCARFSPARLRGAALFVVLTSAPLLHNFKWGQVSIAIVLLVYACFLAERSGRTVLAALLLACAAAIKYYPAMFLLFFLARRRTRFALAFAAWLLVLFLGIPAVVLGPQKSLEFHRLSRESWRRDSARHALDVNSQYFPSVATRWKQALQGTFAPVSPSPSLRIALAAAGIAVFAGAALLAIRERGGRRDPRIVSLRSASLLFAATPFLVPTSWPHYFVFLPCAQAIAAGEVQSETNGARRIVLWVVLLLSILLGSMIPFAHFTGWRTYSYLGGPFLANAFVLALLADGTRRRETFGFVPSNAAGRPSPAPALTNAER